jgi:radical SAM superfamily enzyme YgiQ (UPF0313 family)
MNKISIIGVIPKYPRHTEYNIYSRIRMPPVGIISVLSQISHDDRFQEVYAIDENNYKGPRDFNEFPDHKFLQDRRPAGIALFYGGMSNSIPRMLSLAQQYKRFNAVTIAGGSHVDALPQDALKAGVDIVVHGEGEEIIKDILEVIVKDGMVELDPERLSQVKGISFLGQEGKPIFTGKRQPIADLNRLKEVDLTLIKYLEKRWSAIPVSRGRGCNYNCEFCVVNKQYGKFKATSNERALNQIIKHSDMGYKNFFMTDDNFAQNVNETIELCKMIGDYKTKFHKKLNLTVQVRSEVAENDELIEAMRYASVKTQCIGYESPVKEDLLRMTKGVTAEKLIARSRKLSKNFYLHGMFIFGYPTFADSKFKSTLTLDQRAKAYSEFFSNAKIDTVQVMNAIPLPGSLLREKLLAENRVLPLEEFGYDKYDGMFLTYVPSEGENPYDLQELPKTLMKRWYLGNPVNNSVNYGNWMNWAYTATVGFPIDFGVFYTKRFIHNLAEGKRKKSIEREELLPNENIFYDSLLNSWQNIKKRWRNLAVKTYAGGIVRGWMKEYKNSDYSTKMRQYFQHKTPQAVPDESGST